MPRVYCTACKRLQQNCLCDAVTPVDNSLRTLFLQHPLEQNHVKNTAWLAHCCLQQSQFEIGETFAAQDLEAWLCPGSVLLYPQTEEFEGEVMTVDQLKQNVSAHQLVVLDGTWKKTRKMLFVNPLLAQLPRVQLAPAHDSQYAIRKQKNAQSLSTLEAVQQLLVALEDDEEKYQPLQSVFVALMKQQLGYRSRT